MTEKQEDFCPWCGKTLPEELQCVRTCPHERPHIRWWDRFHLCMTFSGVALFSICAFYVARGFAGDIAGMIAFFIPSVVFSILVR